MKDLETEMDKIMKDLTKNKDIISSADILPLKKLTDEIFDKLQKIKKHPKLKLTKPGVTYKS